MVFPPSPELLFFHICYSNYLKLPQSKDNFRYKVKRGPISFFPFTPQHQVNCSAFIHLSSVFVLKQRSRQRNKKSNYSFQQDVMTAALVVRRKLSFHFTFWVFQTFYELSLNPLNTEKLLFLTTCSCAHDGLVSCNHLDVGCLHPQKLMQHLCKMQLTLTEPIEPWD